MGAKGKSQVHSATSHEHPNSAGGRQPIHFTTIYDRFNGSRATLWFLLLLCALTAGMLAPSSWVESTYQTTDSLLGTPAEGDIKAPRHIAVEDKEVTQARRTAALAAVPRVYDIDTQLTRALVRRLNKSFAAARKLAQEETDTSQAQTTALFRDTMGDDVPISDLDPLAELKFHASVEQAVVNVVRTIQDRPIIRSRQALRVEANLGITLQRIPLRGIEPETVEDIDSILESAEVSALARDLLGAEDLAGDESVKLELARLISKWIRPNMTPNRAATEAARDLAQLSVKTVSISVKQGEMIVRDGQRYTQRHLLVLRALNQSTQNNSRWTSVLGAVVLTLLLLAGVIVFSRQSRWARRLRAREYFFLTSAFLLSAGGAKLWLLLAQAVRETYPVVNADICIYAMPLAAGVMVVGLVLRAEPTVVTALVNGVLLTLMASENRLIAIYFLVGTLTAATAVRRITARGDVLRAGAWVGFTQACTVIGMLLFEGQLTLVGLFLYAPVAFGSGILSAAVALSLMPMVEFVFRYTTELKLLELANLNHPALKELLVDAPGSYHHSIMVGALVEAAAEAIGANSLLTRVMAYYHDLGKGCNAPYFIENQRDGTNPHNKLKASMSAMVIKRHVTDGLEIAKRHKLGEPILASIAEHHGTTLIQYFYHKAKEECEPGESVTENEYRYPGRKPQTREAALVMIGDSIEAAARTLADPTPARLQGLVNKIINMKFTDGQLDECDLTLKDLHLIAKAFTRVLTSIYHKRIEYPEMSAPMVAQKRDEHGNRHSEHTEQASAQHDDLEENRPDNLRRLGL